MQGCCCQAGEIVQISFDWRDVLFTENMLTNLWKIEANEQPVIHGIEIIQQNSQEKNLSKWYRVKWSQDKNQDKIRSLIYWLNSMLVRWWDGIFLRSYICFSVKQSVIHIRDHLKIRSLKICNFRAPTSCLSLFVLAGPPNPLAVDSYVWLVFFAPLPEPRKLWL